MQNHLRKTDLTGALWRWSIWSISSSPPHRRQSRAQGGGFFVLLLLVLLLPFFLPRGVPGVGVASVVAQEEGQEEESPIRLEVEMGYQGYYVTGQWFPVTIMVRNDGPDVRGILEWDFLDGDRNNTFQREIDLPRGAQKRVTLHAFSESFHRMAEVRLLEGTTTISSQAVQVKPLDQSSLVIGVLSRDATLLNSLSALDMDNASTTIVVHLEADRLPEHPRSLGGVDVLFVHDIPTEQWSAGQKAALDLWVRVGGQLVVSGGASARQSTPGLADLLPVTVLDLESQAALTSLPFFIQRHTPEIEETLPERTTVSSVELKPGADPLDMDGHLVAHDVGSGRVVFSRFDLSVLRAWVGEPDLWERVLHPPAFFTPTTSPLNFRMWDVLQLPSLRLPSFWVLVLFMVGYIVAVGPLNFLVLRLFRRPELAWLTIPATVFVFVVGTYGVNLLLRGTDPEMMQLAIVQGFEGKEERLTTSYVGLFSPYRNTYTLTFPPETLVREEDRFSFRPVDVPVTWTENATELRRMLVDVSSLRIFVAERTVREDAPALQVQSRLQRTGEEVQGELRNTSSEPLLDAVLVYEGTDLYLGTILPGETREVQLTRGMSNFPSSIGNQLGDDEATFDRRRILFSLAPLFWGETAIPIPSRDTPIHLEPYVLFWREQPQMEVQVNGRELPQDSLTLYVIQLNG